MITTVLEAGVGAVVEWSFVAVLVLVHSAVVYALALRARLPRALVGWGSR